VSERASEQVSVSVCVKERVEFESGCVDVGVKKRV
jgi:hypothetical protein